VTTSQTFSCRPEAVTAARRFVRDVLVDQPLEIVQAAELMASELATNCVRHARTDFELVIRSQGQIRIEVRDTGEGRPTPLTPAPRELSGRGLLIVEAMSDAWGVIPASSGKTVWFTLPQPRASSEASRSAASSRGGAEERGRRGADASEQPDRLRSGQTEARARTCARRGRPAYGRRARARRVSSTPTTRSGSATKVDTVNATAANATKQAADASSIGLRIKGTLMYRRAREST
jgi:anti-sigma regulatory factor (Ser/Thr protein kinase)